MGQALGLRIIETGRRAEGETGGLATCWAGCVYSRAVGARRIEALGRGGGGHLAAAGDAGFDRLATDNQ